MAFDNEVATTLFFSKDKKHTSAHKLREKDKTVSRKPTPALAPFWEKFISGGSGGPAASTSTGTQSPPWGKYMQGGRSGGKVATAPPTHATKKTKKHAIAPSAPPTNMWDKYMNGGGNMGGGIAPTAAATSSKNKHAKPTHTLPPSGNPWDKYMTMGGQPGGAPIAAVDSDALLDTLEFHVSEKKSTTPPPTNYWDKYMTMGGKAGGGAAISAVDTEAAADTLELSVSDKKKKTTTHPWAGKQGKRQTPGVNSMSWASYQASPSAAFVAGVLLNRFRRERGEWRGDSNRILL